MSVSLEDLLNAGCKAHQAQMRYLKLAEANAPVNEMAEAYAICAAWEKSCACGFCKLARRINEQSEEQDG